MKNEKLKLILKAMMLFLCIGFVSCNSSTSSKIIDKEKKSLLSINKNWDERTDSEKVIGCWMVEPERLKGTGNPRTLKGDNNYMLIFYSDGTMDNVTFFTIGFTKTDPLIYHHTDFSINNGFLSYKYNGQSLSHPIQVERDKIRYLGRTYIKGNCPVN